MNFPKVIFEIDSSIVAEAIWFGNLSSINHPASWISYCLEELSNHKDWSLNLIRREVNYLADIAAKQAKISGISWLRVDASSMFLSQSICAEL